MKVLLIKDVYKLGHAGDVKRVADGYGRNYLLPQGLAVLASPGAMKQADSIRTQAAASRAILNKELSGVAELLSDVTLTFPVKAGETGKLYGSITSQMIAEALQDKTGVDINRRQLDSEPIRNLGTHKVHVRLTVDLVPEITVVVHREGEPLETAEGKAAEETAEATAEGAEEAAPVEAMAEVAEEVEPVEAMAEVAEEVEPAETVAEVAEEAEPAETVAEVAEEAEPAEAVAEVAEDSEPAEADSEAE